VSRDITRIPMTGGSCS